MTRRLSVVVAATVLVGATLYAQGPPPATPSRAQAPEPWRRTGARPCVRPGQRLRAVPRTRRASPPFVPAACSTASLAAC